MWHTVIYKMKPRADMTPEESQKCLRNMIEAVVNTTDQNFYIVAKNGRIKMQEGGVEREKDNYVPIHLKGYRPADFSVKGFDTRYEYTYKDIFDANVAQNNADLDASEPYMSKTGLVWAFKCPTLTKHVWEKQFFGSAYPHYEEWVKSNGAVHEDWYKEDVDGVLLTCWW